MSRLSLLNFCLTSAQHDWQYQFWSLCQVCNHHSLPTYRLTHEFLWSMCCSSIVFVSSIQTICLDCADQIQHDLFDVWYLKQLHETKDWNSFEFTQDFVHQTLGSLFNLFTVWVNHAIMLFKNTVREASQTRHGFFQTWEMYHMFGNSPYLERYRKPGGYKFNRLRDASNLESMYRTPWEKCQIFCEMFPKNLERPTSYLERYIKSKNYPQKHSEIYPIPWEIATIYTLRDFIYPIFRKIHPMPSDNYHIYALCRRFSKPWVRQRR